MYNRNDRVEWIQNGKSYGEGTVVAILGEPPYQRVKVQWDSGGAPQLLMSWSKTLKHAGVSHWLLRNPAIGLPPRDDITRADYPAIFGDFDADKYPNVDDPHPWRRTPDVEGIEETLLSDQVGDLIDARKEFVFAKDQVVDELRAIAPSSKIYARVKSPFSILGKLQKKFLSSLKDLAGTTMVVDTNAEVFDIGDIIEETMDVRQIKNYYDAPKNGYRALHYIVEAVGRPVEIQIKTFRQAKLNAAAHHPMKMGTLDVAQMDYLSALAYKADDGNRRAAHQIDRLLNNVGVLKGRLTL